MYIIASVIITIIIIAIIIIILRLIKMEVNVSIIKILGKQRMDLYYRSLWLVSMAFLDISWLGRRFYNDKRQTAR